MKRGVSETGRSSTGTRVAGYFPYGLMCTSYLCGEKKEGWKKWKDGLMGLSPADPLHEGSTRACLLSLFRHWQRHPRFHRDEIIVGDMEHHVQTTYRYHFPC